VRDVVVDRLQEICSGLRASHLKTKKGKTRFSLALWDKEKRTHPQVVMCRPTGRQHAKPKVARVLSDRATHPPKKRHVQHYRVYSILPHHLRNGEERGGKSQSGHSQDASITRNSSPSRAPPRSSRRLLRRSMPVPRSFHWF
jgi:hypothetical protein